jgi:DNA mismatch repair ATPase MutS
MHDIRNVLIQVKDLERSLQRIHLRTAGPSDLLSIVSTLQNALEISRLLSLRWSQDLAIEYSLKSTDLISSLVKKYDSFFEEEAFTTNKFESAGLIRDGVSDLLDEARQHHLNLLGEKEIMKEKLSKIFTTAEFSLGDDLRYGPIIILPKLNLTRRKHLMDILEHRSGFDFLKTNKKSTTSSQILTYQPWTNLSFAMREQENRMMLIERNLFAESCADLICHDKDILRVSRFLAEIDVSSSLGFIAKENRYTRPIIVDEPIHDVKGGRHPVVELSQLQRCQTFIKNDCHIGEREQLWLLYVTLKLTSNFVGKMRLTVYTSKELGRIWEAKARF